MKLFDAFERIVVINLPERTDRRSEMMAELGKAGVDAFDPRLRFLPAIRPTSAGAFPGIGARGRYASHLAAIDSAIRDRVSGVLILEDDLALSPAACEAQYALTERLQAGNWDFCYPGHALPQTSAAAHPAWKVTNTPLESARFYGLHRRVLVELRDYLEACAHRAPGHPDGGPMHVDAAYSMFRDRRRDLVTLVATPSLGGTRSSRSDFTDDRWYRPEPVAQVFSGQTRNMLRAASQSAVASR